MERAIITINESGYVNIPDGDVWMPEMKLVELFGVIAPTLRATIKAIYRNGVLNSETSKQCEVITSASWATFYNLELVVALAFRLNTYEASMIRQKVLEGLTQRKKERFNYFFALKSARNDKYYHIERNN